MSASDALQACPHLRGLVDGPSFRSCIANDWTCPDYTQWFTVDAGAGHRSSHHHHPRQEVLSDHGSPREQAHRSSGDHSRQEPQRRFNDPPPTLYFQECFAHLLQWKKQSFLYLHDLVFNLRERNFESHRGENLKVHGSFERPYRCRYRCTSFDSSARSKYTLFGSGIFIEFSRDIPNRYGNTCNFLSAEEQIKVGEPTFDLGTDSCWLKTFLIVLLI